MRRINDAGYNLIREFEGFRGKPYQDSGGVWTQGYGHTDGVTADSPDITQEQADDWLDDDLEAAETIVGKLPLHLTDNQFAALVSLVFNCGKAPLNGTIGRMLEAGNYRAAATAFLLWNHIGTVVSDGLTRRRQAEMKLFLTPNYEDIQP